jgi:hypothetical protein
MELEAIRELNIREITVFWLASSLYINTGIGKRAANNGTGSQHIFISEMIIIGLFV